MASTDARSVPQKNVAYRVTFPILDADGDLVTAAATLDSEVSKDGGTFADCTNEAAEIATSSGMYYLDLTSTEMNADTVAIIVKTATAGAKTVPIVLYPEEAGDIRVNLTQILGTAVSTPATAGILDVNVKNIDNDAASASGTVTFPNATLASTTNITGGTVTTATNVTTVNGLAASVITAASIAADAITDAKVASDVTIASVTGAVGSVTGAVGSVAGAVGSVTGAVGSVTGAVGSVTGNVGGNVIGTVASVAGAVGSVTGLTASDVGAIKAKADSLTFTVAGKVDANPTAINGDATSAASLAKTTRAIGRGTVTAAASTTSIPTSAFTPAGAVADQFKGRIITFDSDTTSTALRGQSTDITASSNAAAPTFTCTALTTAPASGDTFSVT